MIPKEMIIYAHHAVVRIEEKGPIVVTDPISTEEKAWNEANQRQLFALERGSDTTFSVEELPTGKFYFRRRTDRGGTYDTIERHGYTDGTHGSKVG